MRLGSADFAESGGQIDPHRFVAVTRRGIEIEKHLPGARLQAHLFLELPGGTEVRGLAGDVQEPGR